MCFSSGQGVKAFSLFCFVKYLNDLNGDQWPQNQVPGHQLGPQQMKLLAYWPDKSYVNVINICPLQLWASSGQLKYGSASRHIA